MSTIAHNEPLYQKYRPKKWSELVGQRGALRDVRTALARGWGGRAWWISGPSGSGKTTLAYLIARQGAEDWCIEELDASDVSALRLKEIERTMQLYGVPPKGGRVWIINEAHGLRRSDTLRQLLVLLERLPRHVCVIFTTSSAGEQLLMEDLVDAGPLLSRCFTVELHAAQRAFAVRTREIAEAEGLNGLPLAAYIDLARRHDGNFRWMLAEVETGRLRYQARDRKGPASKPKSGCRGCGASVRPGRKFCAADCYLKWLRASKRKR